MLVRTGGCDRCTGCSRSWGSGGRSERPVGASVLDLARFEVAVVRARSCWERGSTAGSHERPPGSSAEEPICCVSSLVDPVGEPWASRDLRRIHGCSGRRLTSGREGRHQLGLDRGCRPKGMRTTGSRGPTTASVTRSHRETLRSGSWCPTRELWTRVEEMAAAVRARLRCFPGR